MAENDQLKELQEQYRDVKARNSDLSNALDLSRREIKALQNNSDLVEPLQAEVGSLKAELDAAYVSIAGLNKAAQDASVNTSAVEKRAAAFLAIRAALETK